MGIPYRKTYEAAREKTQPRRHPFFNWRTRAWEREKRFSKEEKQDLMHIGVCRLLSQSGYYEFEGRDEDGWPHFKLLKPVPKVDLEEQEELLRIHIKEYFADL